MGSLRRFLAASFLGAVAFAFTGAAVAQELQVDPKALDASGASSTPKGKKAGRVGKPSSEKSGQSAGKGSPDRQFGELEGWSPGKAPPGAKEKEETKSGTTPGAGISTSPSGNMSVGLPF